MARIKFIRQLGYYDRCARAGCGKSPQYRVILGSFVVQVYSCTPHVVWAASLDMIGQDQGEAMGWEHGYKTPGSASKLLKPVEIVPEMGVIKRYPYGKDRSAEIDASYPYYVEGSDIPHFRP